MKENQTHETSPYNQITGCMTLVANLRNRMEEGRRQQTLCDKKVCKRPENINVKWRSWRNLPVIDLSCLSHTSGLPYLLPAVLLRKLTILLMMTAWTASCHNTSKLPVSTLLFLLLDWNPPQIYRLSVFDYKSSSVVLTRNVILVAHSIMFYYYPSFPMMVLSPRGEATIISEE